ncbi:MAG: S8 family serine peptidase [Candidatus Thorarchaeota archaeon]
MEGHRIMPAISKPTFTLIILAIIMFTPTSVWSGVSDSSSPTMTGMSANLALTVASSHPDDVIPVVAQFPEGSTPEEMTNAIRMSGLPSVIIRHAFHIIPMVSLYIQSDEVSMLSENVMITSLTLDMKRQIAADPIPVEQATVAANGDSYTHFTDVLGVEPMWDMGYNGTGIVVAVLDSGVDNTHPDLLHQVIGFKDLINFQDDMTPGDGIDGYDDNGHGTACVWNIAGDGTASGGNLTGIAPGASILAVKILNDEGAGDDSVIAQGIEFAMDNGADVISLSAGGEWADGIYDDEPSVRAAEAAIEAGFSVVIAAGNSGPQAFSINSPGITEGAITVGSSIDATGVIAFSSVGPVYRYRPASDPSGFSAKPDVVAPGYGVVSGLADNANPFEYFPYNYTQFGTNYTIWAGTSASTPMVAGAVAVLMQRHLLLTPDEAKAALMASARDLGLDPMVQGWGIVNVTKASELLVDSTRDITIMTPRRFPTLPWSDNVLIVGDDRPPQNITVISTQSVGLVNVSLTGNASLFVTTPDQISVAAGYSYLDIKLDIPEDLPMTEVGWYNGALNLTSYGEVVATIEIGFTITLFGGRLMVDMEHHTGLAEGGDPDYPLFYGYFTEYLRESGVTLSEFGDPDDIAKPYLDLGTLSGSDIFMIMDTELDYGEEEIAALHSFVNNGGTLFVLSEFWDSSTQEASFGIDSYNDILEPFGIQCERRGIGVGVGDLGLVYDSSTGSVAENDTLMEGVDSLYINIGSTLSVDPSVSNARGLFWEDAAKTHAIVATAQYGSGNVLVVSDGSTLYDDILYDAIRAGADNLRLLRNIASAIVPEAPRIFDVVLNRGEFGEPANVTAYIFDEDLDVVSMSIIGPQGNNITGVVTESLGYKFTSSFTYTSGGFYSFLVVATDASGNERIFQKVILIPVDAADDMFIQTVIYSLLGIVAVGLAYSGYLKYKPKRRSRPRQFEPKDDEWEVPPPSIE